MKGFFSVQQKDAPIPTVARCGTCGLYRHCRSPKVSVAGEGRKGILIVGEVPGEDTSEKRLRNTLKKRGMDLYRDCWRTSAVICRPPKNRSPTDTETGACLPNLLATIEEKNPHAVILLGGVAVRSLIGHVWKKKAGGINEWVGWRIPCRNPNIWICPTYCPTYLVRMNREELDYAYEKHLFSAIELSKRPWGDDIPDDKTEAVTSPSRAAKIIRKFTREGGLTAFDYETTGLKPEGEFAQIISCSICWKGKRTIAYPWEGEAIEATKEYLESASTLKIASNLKFEERWTREKLGIGVTNWHWDTMIAAHVLDNRTGITSIKFQSFVLLGAPSYDEHIKEFLRGKDSLSPNRIRELPLEDLLRYNALDSLLEFQVAIKQMRLMGWPFKGE